MNEQHGRDFLEFVASNQERLRKNLRKNITFDPDLFDDVTATTIVKVFNAITGGTMIENFEQYFFIASKFEYINQQNRKKRHEKGDDNEILYCLSHGMKIDLDGDDAIRLRECLSDENDWKEIELRNDRINELFRFISERLNSMSPAAECDIFLIYYRLKAEKAGISYKKLSEITGRSLKEITLIIQKLKQYVKNDNEIQEKKRRLLDGI